MAALDFPNAPTVGQQYTAPNGALYSWDGAAWTVSGVISTGSTAGGSLAGTYPNPSVAASAIRGTPSSGGTAREIAKASLWAGDDLIDLSVTAAKHAAGSSVRGQTSAAAPTSFTTNNVSGAWITIVTLPALVTVGGTVLLFGTAGLLYSGSTNVLVILGIFRDGTQYFTVRWQPAASTGGTLGLPLPTIAVLDNPAAASHVYTLKIWVNGAGANVVTSGGDTGGLYALELC